MPPPSLFSTQKLTLNDKPTHYLHKLTLEHPLPILLPHLALDELTQRYFIRGEGNPIPDYISRVAQQI